MGLGLGGAFWSFTMVTFLFVSSSSSDAAAKTCSNYAFASNRVFSACNDLPVLNSFIHYTYDPSARTLRVAYRHTDVGGSGWVAWAVNPSGRGMVGSQAVVAVRRGDGTVRAYTSPITGYSTRMEEGELSFPVSEVSAAAYSGGEMVVFATLGLRNGSTAATLNQVWQDGRVSGDTPMAHATSGDNVKSMGTLDVLSGRSGSVGGSSKTQKRNIHGVLNAISWGVLMPIGAIMARYLRVFQSADPAWFYLHLTCQTSAYIIGVAGWATGIRLGGQSPDIQFTSHRVIGIILFCAATLQVIALLVRPNKEHKFRIYWNIYHHSLGYGIIILGIVNVFKGFDILNPEKKWERAYTGTIVVLAMIAMTLEAYTWFVVLRRKKAEKAEKLAHGMGNGSNGTNGHNGYGGMTNGRV